MSELSANWKIKGGDAADWVTCASLGIPDISFAFRNRAIDTARFSIPVPAADAAPVFAVGSRVQFQLLGNQVFCGKIREVPEATISGGNEAIAYAVVSPWWDLEHVVYQQLWAERSGGVVGTVWKSHTTLCQDQAGNRISTSAQILDALNYAIAAGADFVAGPIFDGVMAPTRDGSDMSCAEVVKAMIRWTPDISAWFDYSTTPPVLHMARRAHLTPISLPLAGAISDTLQIKRRDDLQAPCVALKYEQTSSDNDGSWATTLVDKYPPDGNEQAVNALVQTMGLSGSRTTYQRQPVVTKAIPDEQTDPTNIIDWVRRKEGWLAKLLRADQLELVAGSYYRAIPDGQVYLDGITKIETAGNSALSPADIPHELISGSITDWMQEAYPNLRAARVTVGALLSFKGAASDVDALELSAAQKKLIKNAFNLGADASDPGYNAMWRYYEVTATNASSMVYQIIAEAEAGEAVPTGLAEQLWVALNTLHWEGSFKLTGDEVSTAPSLANFVNLTGSANADWAAMNAQVQEISWQAASGETAIKFGPPEHLSPQDMLEFLRGLRTMRPTFAAPSARTTGEASANATAGGAGWTPSTTTPNPPGGGGGDSRSPWHPYRVNVLAPLTDGTPQVAVDFNSDLWKDFSTKQDVSGLGTAFAPAIGDLIWLHIGVTSADSITPDEATIEHGAPWEGHPNPILYTSEAGTTYQTEYNQIIAEVVAESDPRDGVVAGSGDKAVKVIQRLKSSIRCTLRAVNGIVCIVPESCSA